MYSIVFSTLCIRITEPMANDSKSNAQNHQTTLRLLNQHLPDRRKGWEAFLKLSTLYLTMVSSKAFWNIDLRNVLMGLHKWMNQNDFVANHPTWTFWDLPKINTCFFPILPKADVILSSIQKQSLGFRSLGLGLGFRL